MAGKRRVKEYEVVEYEAKISEEERQKLYEEYKELLYRLLFKGEFRKSKQIGSGEGG